MKPFLVRGGIRLSGSVLTHPARGEAAARVAAQAPPGLLRTVTDPRPDGPPTALRTALAAWGSVPPDSTHHLVVQDDMLLAEGVWDRLLDAIGAAPEAALALFAAWDSRNGAMVRIGALTGAGWVPAVGEYTPCAALMLPRSVASSFAAGVREETADGWPDDILMQRHLRASCVRCLIAVPNLAEHVDGPSIVGNAFRGPRRSACFLPVAPERPVRIAEVAPTLVPFLKNGVAQCVEGTPGGAWLHLELEPRLRLLGVTASRLRPPGLSPAEREVWLTGYALGLVSRDSGTIEGTPRVDAVVAEALRTIAPGGTSQRPGESPAGRAELAVIAGRTDVLDPPRARYGIPPSLLDDPFLAHAAAYLAEAEPHAAAGPAGPDAVLTSAGDLYGPGCGPDGVIGALVWEALRSRPIVLTDDFPAVIRPVHVREAAAQIAGGLPIRGRARYPLRMFAQTVAEVVRPVPVHDLRLEPSPAGELASEELRYRLHHYAQWLAYEWRGGTARVTSTAAADPSAP